MVVNEILLDIDFKDVKFFKQLGKQLNTINYLSHIKPLSCVVYETNKGFHVYLKVSSKQKLSQLDLMFFQGLLSDDYKRELFNWNRLKKNGDSENLLFYKKYSLVGHKLLSQEKITFLSMDAVNNFWLGYYGKPKKQEKFKGKKRGKASITAVVFYSIFKITNKVRGFI